MLPSIDRAGICAFLAKEWPKRELDDLTAREVAGQKEVILPIWPNIGREEVLQRNPASAN